MNYTINGRVVTYSYDASTHTVTIGIPDYQPDGVTPFTVSFMVPTEPSDIESWLAALLFIFGVSAA